MTPPKGLGEPKTKPEEPPHADVTVNGTVPAPAALPATAAPAPAPSPAPATPVTETATNELVRQTAWESGTPDNWYKLRMGLSATGSAKMQSGPAIRLLIAGYSDPIAHDQALKAIKEHQLSRSGEADPHQRQRQP